MNEAEKRERQQREREAMRQAIAAYTGPITKCPPGRSTNALPRQKRTPTLVTKKRKKDGGAILSLLAQRRARAMARPSKGSTLSLEAMT
jgi:hypothetical protein